MGRGVSGISNSGKQQTLKLKNGRTVTATVYSKMPQGWKVLSGAMNAPNGYVTIYNGKSLFGGQRKTAFLKK